LIERANLPILSEPIEIHLQQLETRLEENLRRVNRQISDNHNKSFNQPEKSSRWSLKYPTQPETHSNSFFDSMNQIDLYRILRFVHGQTAFSATDLLRVSKIFTIPSPNPFTHSSIRAITLIVE
jgi:hypothetical protein